MKGSDLWEQVKTCSSPGNFRAFHHLHLLKDFFYFIPSFDGFYSCSGVGFRPELTQIFQNFVLKSPSKNLTKCDFSLQMEVSILSLTFILSVQRRFVFYPVSNKMMQK